MHILASPAGVHALPSASASESTMTSAPKATQAYSGIVVRRSRELVSELEETRSWEDVCERGGGYTAGYLECHAEITRNERHCRQKGEG